MVTLKEANLTLDEAKTAAGYETELSNRLSKNGEYGEAIPHLENAIALGSYALMHLSQHIDWLRANTNFKS